MINIFVILIVVFVDQLSKYITEAKLVGKSKAVIKDFFHITHVPNTGVAFGMFQGKLLFIVALGFLAVLAIILYLHKKDEEHSALSRFGYLFILGGAFGNLFDRIYRGYVVDFIDFRGIWPYIFNIADVAINIGIILIIIEYFWEKEDIHTKEPDEQSILETKELQEGLKEEEKEIIDSDNKNQNIE